jgi:23S rRNA (guanosine2251-2'-O)-methyltransferase
LGEGALDELLDRATTPPLLLVLDAVQDPHNLGACLRTADATGVSAVIVPRDRAAGLSPVVRKVASGAAETVPLIQVVNLARTLRWLKERSIWIVGTDDEAEKSLYQTDLKGPLALVLGAEGTGLRRLTRDHCDALVSIPMRGVVESLNVSVAAGVVLFEAIRQRS